jgi:ATP-binding cassette, subfamily B, bacterial MsbA
MSSPASPDNSLHLYKRLLGFTRPYWRLLLISLVGFVLFAAMETLMAHLMKYFVEGLETRDKQLMWMVPLAIVAARIAHGVGSFFGNYYIARVGLGVVNDLRKTLFEHLLYLPSRYFDQNNSGEIISLLTYNVQQVTGSVTNAVKILMRDGFSVIGLFIYLVVIDWKLTLIFVAIAPLLALLVSTASRYFRRLSRRMQVSMGGITHIANEAISGFRLVRSFGAQAYEKDRFDQACDQNNQLSKKYERISALQAPIFHLVIAIDLAIMLFLILAFWQQNTGAAVAYLTAAAMIAKPLRQVATVNEIIQRGLAAAESIFAVVDLPGEPDHHQKALQVSAGRIEFRQLCFSYDGERPALKNVSFTIEPGQQVALVGSSGSGKSTLTHLLLRLYEPDSGEILIDGVPIQQVSLRSLRQQIALVNQQTLLFNDTALRNIAYGTDLDTVSREAVEEAAQAAQAKGFIEALPEGFDSLIGEDGTRLSGGQRQRIAIARALYKNAPILVLDEATSALDNESESAIQSALDRLAQNRTSLVVAHRLSTIEKADCIIVMQDGEIVEMGTHSSLMAANGYYANKLVRAGATQPDA